MGLLVGDLVGLLEGHSDGNIDGVDVGSKVGFWVGVKVGYLLGQSEGKKVGTDVASTTTKDCNCDGEYNRVSLLSQDDDVQIQDCNSLLVPTFVPLYTPLSISLKNIDALAPRRVDGKILVVVSMAVP